MYTDNAPEVVAAISRPKLKHDKHSIPFYCELNCRAINSYCHGRYTYVHYLNNLFSQFNGGHTLHDASVICSMNIAVVDGDSAYNKGHGVEFDGFSIPYGCLADFRPPNMKKAAKFGATPMPGIFIGYTTRWRKMGSRLPRLSIGRFPA